MKIFKRWFKSIVLEALKEHDFDRSKPPWFPQPKKPGRPKKVKK